MPAPRKKKGSKDADNLREYRAKRSAGRTPEPFGPEALDRPRLFVVQKHAARALHFDLRLETGGVLKSWAVPKGPSLDPTVKRLAVRVEDHPVEYADFEGIIPEGNYGAGAVIVWDRGRWISDGDPEEGIEKGKLLFRLEGYKLRGLWTLFKTKRSERDWLLVKKPDEYADPEADLAEASILSGLTVEDLKGRADRRDEIREELRSRKAPRRRVEIGKVEPMLAESRDGAFTDPGWLFELKYDGFRLLAARDGEDVRLRYRRGTDVTGLYPEIAGAVRALPCEGLVLDGELVVLDPRGRPSFQLLQQRSQLRRPTDVRRGAVRMPATYFVFDLLAFERFDVRPLPLVARKEVLAKLLPPAGPVRYSDHVEERGAAMFEEVGRMGLEGVVAKKADSPYRGRRSPEWLKIRADRTGDFVVVGFTRPKGSREAFGALHLAVHDGEGLAYAGRVGTGFSQQDLASIRERLDGMRRAGPAFRGRVPGGGEHVWVEPGLACEVRYKEWTRGSLLRQPVFVRLREDKTVEECVAPAGPSEVEVPAPSAEPSAGPREVRFTNPDKVFWPEEGYTKADLIGFYRSVAPWLLPYLRDRPVVLTRYPDGIEGKSFFQKDAPDFAPEWVRTESMWSEHGEREIDYFVCDNEETLLYLANLGTIPLHVWSSRISSLQMPDWCILDLDPKEAPFAHVVEVARAIRGLCREIDLECFVKTSGSTGLHVLIPLAGQCTYEQSRSLAELLASIVASRLPEIATTARSFAARKGRVYLDYVQNGHGRLLVSPFSVRPLPGAPVSTPLRWSEIGAKLDIRRFDIRSVPRRLRRMRDDPLLPVLTARPDILGALERLKEKLERPRRDRV